MIRCIPVLPQLKSPVIQTEAQALLARYKDVGLSTSGLRWAVLTA